MKQLLEEDLPIPQQAIVVLNNVIKEYITGGRAFRALNGVDLTIGAGEFASIVGKSGSGKSTLINMVTGIDHPTSGEVIIHGTHIHNLQERSLAPWRGRTIGVVFQFFQLLPTLTVLENVLLPMDFCGVIPMDERIERAMGLLDMVEVGDQADKLPSSLSGGQQQRVAIARALANDPPILAADEPTGNLDSRTAESVFELFHSLVSKGKTILMVTHDKDLAARATRTIEVVDGRIALPREVALSS